MSDGQVSITWSSSYTVAETSSTLQRLSGDKILLPPSALEQLLAASTVSLPSQPPRAAFDPFNPYSLAQARQEASQWRGSQQQLPHPLTFRLVNPTNGNVFHAGIREFSAEEGQIVLSRDILTALDIKDEDIHRVADNSSSDPIDLDTPIDLTQDDSKGPPKIVVHAKQLPKGTYVRLRPLEAGYNPDDWKALLERHLRENFTTLTNGEILTVTGRRSRKEEFKFLVDKLVPEGDAICVVDTDLEVDIEALNEDQARETLKQIMTKARRENGTAEGSSEGGDLDLWNAVNGQIVPGDYVDYRLTSWDKTQPLELSLDKETGDDIHLLFSPLLNYQRARPRVDEHVLADFELDTTTKTIRLDPSNAALENCDELYVSIYASETKDEDRISRHFTLRASVPSPKKPPIVELTDTDMETHDANEEQCKNCRQWVPKRTMMLHENFCLRNNISCPQCQQVLKKNSPEWQSHWHCPHDAAHGSSPDTQSTHNNIYHTLQQCPGCEYTANSLIELASHRTTLCPAKLILCQFCHLEVPQEGDPNAPTADQLLSGLTAHELADGSRTTNCHLCDAIVRLRDMSTHLKHHEISKTSKPLPRICRNANCGRTLDGVGKNGDVGVNSRMGQGPGNDLGLCSICFGPLYVSMYDPEGKAMKRRIERRYLSQLITGCTKSWCVNIYCKQGKVHSGSTEKEEAIPTKDALPLIKPLLAHIADSKEPMYFCVDATSQQRRILAEMLAAEGSHEFEWCVAACEGGGGSLEAARAWLRDWAPGKGKGRAA